MLPKPLECYWKLSPEDPESLNYLGLCLLELNNPKEALIAFEKAALFNPENEEALYNAATTLIKARQGTGVPGLF